MAIAFDEVEFPRSISKGATFGPEFSTDIVLLSSGIEKRNSNWTAFRHKGDVSTGVKTPANFATVKAFFVARQGKARGFRYFDWADYSGAAQAVAPGTALRPSSTDVSVSATDNSYNTAGAISFASFLAGDSVYVSGCANAGNNGTKTVVSATAAKLIVSQTLVTEAAGATDVFLKLGPYQLQKIYADSAQSYARAIQKPIAGTVVVYFAGVAQSTWWTVDTTTGLVTLATSATPANGAAITADFQFDVPVRFDTDTMAAQSEDIGPAANGVNTMLSSWSKIPIVEIRLQ